MTPVHAPTRMTPEDKFVYIPEDAQISFTPIIIVGLAGLSLLILLVISVTKFSLTGNGNDISVTFTATEQREVNEFVTKYGSDPNKVDEFGYPLFHVVVGKGYGGNLVIVKYLVAKGANVNAKSKDGDTPLLSACRSGNNAEIVRFLVSKGADVRAKGKGNMTPLHYAVGVDREGEMVEFLIHKGANVNAKNEDGGTPLHLAAGWGNLKAVAVLIKAGADVNIKSNGGDTPLGWARRNGSTAVVEYLSSFK